MSVSDRDCPLVTLAYGTYVARARVLITVADLMVLGLRAHALASLSVHPAAVAILNPTSLDTRASCSAGSSGLLDEALRGSAPTSLRCPSPGTRCRSPPWSHRPRNSVQQGTWPPLEVMGFPKELHPVDRSPAYGEETGKGIPADGGNRRV